LKVKVCFALQVPMEAIDFKKLLREERKRAKQKKKERDLQKAVKVPSEEKKETEDSADHRGNDEAIADARYCWEHPDGFLAFRQLALKTICDDPRSISYSSAALEKQTIEEPNTKENESVSNEPSVSGASVPPRITNGTKAISPETALLSWLQNLPSGDSGLGEWKVMNYGKRRVCMFGEDGVLPRPLAEIARELVTRNVFPSSSSPPPNHVLLNEYQAGQGILPHTDGPRYEDRTATLSLGSDVVIEFTKRLTSSEIGSAKQATTTTHPIGVNDGEREEMNINQKMEKSNTDPLQVLLESGSLLVFQGDAYMNYCHGIGMDVWRDVTTENCLNADSGIIVPRGLRYSLTFRHKKTETK